MAEPTSERKALQEALLEETHPSTESTPTDEELLGYLDGKLDADAEGRLQEHLARHPRTTRRLLDLQGFAQATREPIPEIPDLATAAGWKDFERRLEPEAPPAAEASRWWKIAASVLFVTTLALAGQVWRLGQQAPPPEINFATLALPPAQRSDPTVHEVEVEPEQRLRLLVYRAEGCSTYRAEIFRFQEPESFAGEASEAETLEGWQPDDQGRLEALVYLPPGEYALSLSGCDPPRELDEIRFRVRQTQGSR